MFNMIIENNINICIGYLKKKYLKILNEFTVKKNNRTQIYKHKYMYLINFDIKIALLSVLEQQYCIKNVIRFLM